MSEIGKSMVGIHTYPLYFGYQSTYSGNQAGHQPPKESEQDWTFTTVKDLKMISIIYSLSLRCKLLFQEGFEVELAIFGMYFDEVIILVLEDWNAFY